MSATDVTLSLFNFPEFLGDPMGEREVATAVNNPCRR